MNLKILFINLLIYSSLTIPLSHVQAQVFSADQNPPTLKWKQIQTKNFQIIYPSEAEIEAQRMANTLDNIIERASNSLNKKPKKISVILQNQGTTSNGFVQLAPRRSEFYMMPSQAFDYQNWLNSLAVHELRHVVQFDKLTGRYNFPPLESIALSIFGITLPPWFYEGDAVNIETSLTKAGRGKQPEWNINLRSNLLSNRHFSYSKNYFSSYKNFTPGYYQLGHFMNAKLRRSYGSNIMDRLFTRMADDPIRPYNLSNSIRSFTGLTTRKLHDSTMHELEGLWREQLAQNKTRDYISLNKRESNVPSHYSFPTSIGNGNILYLKQSKGEAPAFYILNSSGKSKKLFRIGSQEDTWFSYAVGKIAWDENRSDLRYQQRSFNVINIYDLKTRKRRQLTHRTRLFAPALSPDGKLIAAVDISYANKASIVELDAATGKEMKRYSNPLNYMMQMPSYDASGNKIIMVGIATTGKTLLELDRNTGTTSSLLPLQLQEILKPVYAGEQIIFKAHYNGIDNLYRLNKSTGEIDQLTSAKFGAFNPSFDSSANQILFNNFTSGQDIATIKLNELKAENITSIKNTYVNYAQPLYEQEGNDDVFDSIPNVKFESKRYSDLQLKNLFYFHSIYPLSGTDVSGLELRSDNKLNTVGIYADYLYNSALRKNEFGLGFEFKKYFPVLTVDYRNYADYIYRANESTPVSWREDKIEAFITVPFTFNKFNYNYSLGAKTGTSFTKRYDINRPFPALATDIKFPLHHQFYARRSSLRAQRDLAPKWAQSLTLDYRNFPFDNFLEGDLLSLKTNFYFPGIFQNHSFQTSFNWQSSSGDYRLNNDITRVSGYWTSSETSRPYNTLLFNYRFPLFYPDWELGPLAYIKRFKGGFFSDFQNIGHENPFEPKSFGAELRADMNILRFYLPNFDIGERVIFMNNKTNQNPIFEFLINYNL